LPIITALCYAVEINKEIELKKLGDRIREIRLSKGLTQGELASKMDRDDYQTIQRLETGNTNPTYSFLLEVCFGLDISMKELFS